MRLSARAVLQMPGRVGGSVGASRLSSDTRRACSCRSLLTYLHSRASESSKRYGGRAVAKNACHTFHVGCSARLLPSSCRACQSPPRRPERKIGSSSEAPCRKDCAEGQLIWCRTHGAVNRGRPLPMVKRSVNSILPRPAFPIGESMGVACAVIFARD